MLTIIKCCLPHSFTHICSALSTIKNSKKTWTYLSMSLLSRRLWSSWLATFPDWDTIAATLLTISLGGALSSITRYDNINSERMRKLTLKSSRYAQTSQYPIPEHLWGSSWRCSSRPAWCRPHSCEDRFLSATGRRRVSGSGRPWTPGCVWWDSAEPEERREYHQLVDY